MREQEILEKLRQDLKKKMSCLNLKQKDVCLLTGVCQSVLSSFLSSKKGISAIVYIKLNKFTYNTRKNKRNDK